MCLFLPYSFQEDPSSKRLSVWIRLPVAPRYLVITPLPLWCYLWQYKGAWGVFFGFHYLSSERPSAWPPKILVRLHGAPPNDSFYRQRAYRHNESPTFHFVPHTCLLPACSSNLTGFLASLFLLYITSPGNSYSFIWYYNNIFWKICEKRYRSPRKGRRKVLLSYSQMGVY